MAAPVVLLVDDSPGMGVLVPALGRRAGWQVDWRADAGSAWGYLQETVPDLTLLDVHLPGPSGLDLCCRIRAAPQTAGLAVALFTHWGMPEDIASGLEAGVDYFVCKDLVSDPERWRCRLADIVPLEHGHGRPGHVGWTRGPARPPRDWVSLLHGTLRHPALRGVGPAVMQVLLRRALEGAFPPGRTDAVLPDGQTLDAGRLPACPRPDEWGRLVNSLAEQVWCLLGTADSAPFLEALAVLVFAPPELPTRS
jgi:CheY-like chemotaxis protein